jgi:hypothetical protein
VNVDHHPEDSSFGPRMVCTKCPAHVVIDALRDETGTLLGFAKITRDITERKEDH